MSTLTVATVKSNSSSPPQFQNTSGTEVGTLCRAWVNFNGTGTVAIRASFNVSSITDFGAGNYSLNFTNAMPDANYSAVSGSDRSGNPTSDLNVSRLLHSYGTSTLGFKTGYPSGLNTTDDSLVCTVAIFR